MKAAPTSQEYPESGQPRINSECIQSNQQNEISMSIQQSGQPSKDSAKDQQSDQPISGQPTTSGQPTLPAISGASLTPDTSRAEIPFSSSSMNALGGASGGESSHSSRPGRGAQHTIALQEVFLLTAEDTVHPGIKQMEHQA